MVSLIDKVTGNFRIKFESLLNIKSYKKKSGNKTKVTKNNGDTKIVQSNSNNQTDIQQTNYGDGYINVTNLPDDFQANFASELSNRISEDEKSKELNRKKNYSENTVRELVNHHQLMSLNTLRFSIFRLYYPELDINQLLAQTSELEKIPVDERIDVVNIKSTEAFNAVISSCIDFNQRLKEIGLDSFTDVYKFLFKELQHYLNYLIPSSTQNPHFLFSQILEPNHNKLMPIEYFNAEAEEYQARRNLIETCNGILVTIGKIKNEHTRNEL